MPYDFDHNYVSKTLIPALNAVVLQTELGGNVDFITRFSLAGAKSTYSFGLYQYDVGNNSAARILLSKLKFSTDQISQLSHQGGLTTQQLASLNQQLKTALADPENAVALDQMNSKWAKDLIAHLTDVLTTVAKSGSHGQDIADQIFKSTALQVQLLDYDNQFHIDLSGKMVAWLEGLVVIMPGGTQQIRPGTTLTKEMLRTFTMSTKYGQNNPVPATTRENALFKVLQTIPPGLPPSYIDPVAPPVPARAAAGVRP